MPGTDKITEKDALGSASRDSGVSPILEFNNLRTSYGSVEVLHGVSLRVLPGEVVTIIGANGAGKTTTLMCASGLQTLLDGNIYYDGIDVSQAAPHELVGRGLVHVPEGRKIFSRLTVFENLELGAFLRRDPQIVEDIEQVYSLFPILKDRAHQLGGTLSGGEQQMLAIGRGLMSKPRVLMMDEPSMGVAPLLVEKIYQAIRLLNEQGMTILLVEQNANLALQLAHRGYVMETGNILFEGSGRELLQDSRVREAYLGE